MILLAWIDHSERLPTPVWRYRSGRLPERSARTRIRSWLKSQPVRLGCPVSEAEPACSRSPWSRPKETSRGC